MEGIIAKMNVQGKVIRLASFREPLSHFFSGFEHMQHPLHPNPLIPHSIAQLIDNLKHGVHYHYDLRNFQSNHLQLQPSRSNYQPSAYNFTEAVLYMRKLDWFSITEEYALSLKLLMCQFTGTVDEAFLANTLSNSRKVRSEGKSGAWNYEISANLLADIRNLNKYDIEFYELAVTEFWERVRKHKQCLNYTLPY
jgi:hypothetical protein